MRLLLRIYICYLATLFSSLSQQCLYLPSKKDMINLMSLVRSGFLKTGGQPLYVNAPSHTCYYQILQQFEPCFRPRAECKSIQKIEQNIWCWPSFLSAKIISRASLAVHIYTCGLDSLFSSSFQQRLSVFSKNAAGRRHVAGAFCGPKTSVYASHLDAPSHTYYYQKYNAGLRCLCS